MRQRIIIWTFLLLSCGTKNSNSTADKDAGSLKTSLSGEEFNDFFEKFKADSLFQIEIVKFPLTMESWDDDEENPTTEKLEISNWRHLKFEYLDEFATRQTDAYTQETKVYTDSTKIELRGVDNGIHIDYDFIKVNGQWFLVSEKDYSN